MEGRVLPPRQRRPLVHQRNHKPASALNGAARPEYRIIEPVNDSPVAFPLRVYCALEGGALYTLKAEARPRARDPVFTPYSSQQVDIPTLDSTTPCQQRMPPMPVSAPEFEILQDA